MSMDEHPLYRQDLHQTLDNRKRLRKNPNLLYWYGKLYGKLFSCIPDINSKKILEIGSGTSPLKQFYPQVITSDVMQLEYLDHVFNCHDIDTYHDIADSSIDIVTLTNVLHHLKDPIRFLQNATKKIKDGGTVILVEPYFSLISHPIYKFLHHEQVNFNVKEPRLNEIDGPLATSNQAIPYMIFFKNKEWRAQLIDYYDMAKAKYSFFSSLSYFFTGGISHAFPMPSWLYHLSFPIDRCLGNLAPRLFASFFIARLTATRAR